uniref:cytochrome-c oxidase n=1 Tax=Pegea confoederata TaxID=942563 RepID=A0AA86IRY1_9UROC|nr:cytochrome c oxidase subunit II [Pegea confoederata]
MFSPSLQMNFYDPMANMELTLYNGSMLALFFLISLGLASLVICTSPGFGYSNIGLNYLQSEMGMFVSTCLVAMSLSLPGLVVLYTQGPDSKTEFMLPVTAFQWYWVMGWENHETELMMENLSNLSSGSPYLLETTDSGVVPMGASTTFYITSSDVLHSFSLPASFVKCDAVPGRLNALLVKFPHPGVQYGQCSELCGVGHSYMPIKIEVVNTKDA